VFSASLKTEWGDGLELQKEKKTEGREGKKEEIGEGSRKDKALLREEQIWKLVYTPSPAWGQGPSDAGGGELFRHSNLEGGETGIKIGEGGIQ